MCAFRRLLSTVCLGLVLTSMGCGTLNSARPLNEGEHSVGVTFGGPFVGFAGAWIPVPNLVVEGKSGLPALKERPFDVNYGLNATGLAFGVIGLHGGASWLALEQRGGMPAVSIADRFYLYNSYLNTQVEPEYRGAWALNQIELTASWAVKQQLLYVGLAEYVDLADPELLLTPFVGAQLARPGRKVSFNLEGRWMAINQIETSSTVDWLGGGRGGIAATAGISVRLGHFEEEGR